MPRGNVTRGCEMPDIVVIWQEIVRDELRSAQMNIPSAARAGQAQWLTNAMKHASLLLNDPARRGNQLELIEAAKMLGDAVTAWQNKKARMEMGEIACKRLELCNEPIR